MFFKKGVLKYFAIFRGKHQQQSLFTRQLQICNFSVNIANFLRTEFPVAASEELINFSGKHWQQRCNTFIFLINFTELRTFFIQLKFTRRQKALLYFRTKYAQSVLQKQNKNLRSIWIIMEAAGFNYCIKMHQFKAKDSKIQFIDTVKVKLWVMKTFHFHKIKYLFQGFRCHTHPFAKATYDILYL